MKKKLETPQIIERILCILAVVFIPNIPLFFLYGNNSAEDIDFVYCLLFGCVLSFISLIIYLLLSKIYFKRRRSLILVLLLWGVFWFIQPLGGLIWRTGANHPLRYAAIIAILIIGAVAYILTKVKMSRYTTNVISVVLCGLFFFNFAPSAFAFIRGEQQKMENARSGELPYTIKSDFNVDAGLPKPNIYWLHMDGMMSFSAIEQYFNDSQSELKKELANRGFLINENARIEGGRTVVAVQAMTNPLFYDTWFGEVMEQFKDQTRDPKTRYINEKMKDAGLSSEYVFRNTEMWKAFHDAGYTNISNFDLYNVKLSPYYDIFTDGKKAEHFDSNSPKSSQFEKIELLKMLVVQASALKGLSGRIDSISQKLRPVVKNENIPEYSSLVDKYVTEKTDKSEHMADMIRAIKYTTDLENPHLLYLTNKSTHYKEWNSDIVGGVKYDYKVGLAFLLDSDGNYYDYKMEDPYDVQLYLPQHKYAVKEMLAQIDVILEADPEAIIVLQGDHGIHGLGKPGTPHFDEDEFARQGYSHEDMLNFNMQVMSAVRVPEKYGKLTEPLDPLDIVRYLVNHCVGANNYDYLYYKEDK